MHPKRTGQSVEAAVINAEPALDSVSDRENHAWDALTTAAMSPTLDRPFGGICVVESNTPVEIKGCIPETSNGSGTVPGRWYIKRESHDQLATEGGVYWLTVYAPRPETPILSQLVVPAATVGDFLDGSWYDNGRRTVAKLTWTRVLNSKDLSAN
ncbi:hypothetical protein SAMN05216226_104223 [Halovenus aranensis]|uniref:Uncharacterized protein n=2 Tax=Halovenus aranensis TaxID=890420 RepID=A0A1G8UF25_9EURY|nr:hypothetical protein SAMN05216226_104223 [Halovenus aranensis]